MADIPTSAWNEVAASNTSAPPDGWPPGSLPTIVYLCDREAMGAIKREWDRNNPTVTSGGSANVQTLTYTVAPTAYVQGMRFSFIAGFTNTGATTLNVSSLGAKAVQLATAALTGGEIVTGQTVEVVYDGTQFQILALPGHYRGGLINVQYFTSAGTSTYTPTTGTNSVVVEVVGGGGGGGATASTGASQVALGASGAAGGYARKRITNSFSGVTVTVGAAGSGGVSGGANATSGGTSSFGALVSATGGGLGAGGPPGSAPAATSGAIGGLGSSGDVNEAGGSSSPSIALSAGVVVAGQGGNSVFGGGGLPQASGGTQAGAGGRSHGAGGSGAVTSQSSSGANGGAGAAGLVIVWEYA